MDTLFLLIAVLITLAALNVGEAGARARRRTDGRADGGVAWN